MLVVLVGILASVFVVALSFAIQRKSIIAISSALGLTVAVQYFLLDKYSTMALACVTLLYGIVSLFERRFPVLSSKYSLVVLSVAYSAVFVLVNGFSFDIEFLAFIASLSGVIIMAMKNQIIVKWLMLVNGITWVIYQINVGALGQLPGEIFYTIGVISSLIILYRAKNRGMDLNKVPEISAMLKNKLMNKKSSSFFHEEKMIPVGE